MTDEPRERENKMLKNTLGITVVILLAMVLVAPSLDAAKKPSAAAPDSKINPKDLSDTSTPAFLDKKWMAE
jgi:hypothetical protein